MERQEWQLGASQYRRLQRNGLQEDPRAEQYAHGRGNFQEGDHGLEELSWALALVVSTYLYLLSKVFLSANVETEM